MAKRRRGGYRISHGGYRYTPRRRQALRKAQLASARKRKGMGTGTKIGIGVGVTGTVLAGAVLGTAVVRHKLSGSELDLTIGRGRRGHEIPERGPGGHGPKIHHIQRGPRRRDVLSAHHRTVQRQDPRDPHIAKAGGVQITASGKDTPYHEEHVFGVSIPGLGNISGTYRHKGVSGRTLKKALSSPTHVQNVLFGKKVISGGRPPQAGPQKHSTPHTPGRRITQAQRDAIPHRKGLSSPKADWPNISAESATKQNVGLREGTHYLHPRRGVVEYPPTARGRKMIDNKRLRWAIGQDRNVLPRDWFG